MDDKRMMTRRGFIASAGILPCQWFPRDVRMADARFRYIQRGVDRRHYIWVHGNETTAGQLLDAHTKTVDGRAFLVRSDVRNVPMDGGKLDPNRMFSDVGAEKNLRTLNPSWSADQIRRAVERLARDRPGFVRRLLPRGRQLLVALHNNSEGYNVQDEVPISDAIALNNRTNPHEFMLCTNRSDFEVLAGGPFNLILQSRAPKDDDGSLSRLCALEGIRYVNIEAALGNAAAQGRMLNWVETLLI